jgi:hypothetical protein
MTIRKRVVVIGAVTGALAVALVLVLVLTPLVPLDRRLGAALGVLTGAAAGAIVAQLAGAVIGRGVVAHLVALDDQRRGHSAGEPPALGVAGLDNAIDG